MKTLSLASSVLLGFGLLFSSGCTNSKPQTSAMAAPAQRPQSSSSRPGSPPPADSIPGIAQREVVRRQESLRQADEAALRAHQAMSDGDLERAMNGYRAALNGLPSSR